MFTLVYLLRLSYALCSPVILVALYLCNVIAALFSFPSCCLYLALI